MPPNNPYQPTPNPLPPAPGPMQPLPPNQVPSSPSPSEYDFLAGPPKPPKRSLLPSGAPPIARVALILGGVLGVILLIVIIKGAVGGSGNTAPLVSVVQDQQELAHLATNALQPTSGQPPSLSSSTEDFASTAKVSMTSSEAQMLAYLKKNGKKVGAKQLALKVSATTDQQLTTAAANSTYESTFKEIMQSKLQTYQADLQRAYSQTSGPKGRELLKQEYQGANLLLKQLGSPTG